MKKWITLALAALFVLTMAACGGNTDDNKAATPPTATSAAPDTSKLTMYGTGFGSADLISALDPLSQLVVKTAAAQEGYTLTINEDGSARYENETVGEVILQNADGTWTILDDSGVVAEICTAWPDNEFTRLIPEPAFAIDYTGTDGMSFSAMFNGPTLEEVQAYAASLAAMGFVPKDYMTDASGTLANIPEIGIMYDYAASKDGYDISVFHMEGSSGLGIMKTAE